MNQSSLCSIHLAIRYSLVDTAIKLLLLINCESVAVYVFGEFYRAPQALVKETRPTRLGAHLARRGMACGGLGGRRCSGSVEGRSFARLARLRSTTELHPQRLICIPPTMAQRKGRVASTPPSDASRLLPPAQSGARLAHGLFTCRDRDTDSDLLKAREFTTADQGVLVCWVTRQRAWHAGSGESPDDSDTTLLWTSCCQ